MMGRYSAGLGAVLTHAKIMEMAKKGDASKLTDQQISMALVAIQMMSGKGGTIGPEYTEIRQKLMDEKVRRQIAAYQPQETTAEAFPVAFIVGGVGILAVLAYIVLKKKR